MFTGTALLDRARTIAATTILLLGCIALSACQGSVNAQESSEVRIELLRVLELQLNVARNLQRSDLAATLEKAIENVQLASSDELDVVMDAVGEIRNYGDSLQKLDLSIQNALQARALESPSIITSTGASPVTLTPPAYFDGGIIGIHCIIPDASNGVRNNTEIVLDAKLAVGAAKTAWAAAEVACGLDAVALASGGLGTVVCAGLASAVAAAEEVVDAFLRCDATVDEAHLDAAFNRAEDNFLLGTHIHDDLATHDTDIKSLLSEIAANQREIIKLLKTPQGKRPGWNDLRRVSPGAAAPGSGHHPGG